MRIKKKVRRVANQWLITVSPRSGAIEIPYGIISKKEMVVASNLLNDKTAAFKLYCNFAINQAEYSFALSPAAIEEELGLSYRQYENARDKLKETGYLVPRRGEKDSYDFVRVPLQYADVSLEDLEFPSHKEKWHQKRNSKEELQGSCAGEVCLGEPETYENELPERPQATTLHEGDLTIVPESGNQCISQSGDSTTLKRGEQTYLKEGRNIINSISNSTNIISGNQQGKCVEEMKKEIFEWEEKIRRDFGDLEDCNIDLLSIASRVKARRYSEKDHIVLLEKYYNSLTLRYGIGESARHRMYQRACEATMPKVVIDRIKVQDILDRLVAEGRIPSQYGAWIQGWDEEQQVVKLTAYSEDLPLEVIRLQRHVLDGIPDWYWKNPKAG